jgi:hypothetical protein
MPLVRLVIPHEGDGAHNDDPGLVAGNMWSAPGGISGGGNAPGASESPERFSRAEKTKTLFGETAVYRRILMTASHLQGSDGPLTSPGRAGLKRARRLFDTCAPGLLGSASRFSPLFRIHDIQEFRNSLGNILRDSPPVLKITGARNLRINSVPVVLPA